MSDFATETSKPRRRVLPLPAWPPIDLQLWGQGTAPGDQLDDPKHADGLKPKTVAGARKGYGCLLAFLAEAGPLDPAIGPAERVTHQALSAFVRALRACNNPNSIKQRLFQVRIAMRIMCPEIDTRWIVRPRGRSLDEWFPAPPRRRDPPDAPELLEWGFGLMAEAGTDLGRHRSLIAYRDGLMIAVLAFGAPRLATLAGMRLGVHLAEDAGEYRISFEPPDLKSPKWQSYPLPPRLAEAMRTYLAVVRPALMQGKRHDWLFVGGAGDRLKEQGIDGMLRRRTPGRFGSTETAHVFRYSLGTAIAARFPDNPGLAAAMLANSLPVAERCYIHIRQELAAQAVNASVRADREETRLLAERLFRDDGDD